MLAACSRSAPPAEAAPVASAPPPAPAASTAAAPPAPAPGADTPKTCADLRDLNACEKECGAGKANACETLGDLHAKPKEERSPGDFVEYALPAFDEGCTLGAKTACDKRDALLEDLRAVCQKNAKDCSNLGQALSRVDGHDKEADESFDRACQAGDASACEGRGELHEKLEPRKLHSAIAEKAFDRACTLGSVSACCSLAGVYQRLEQDKKAEKAMARMESLNDKSKNGRIACDHFRMGQSAKLRVVAKAEGDAVKVLGADHLASVEEVLSRRVPYCYSAAPKEAVRVEVELAPNGPAKVIGGSDTDEGRCIGRVVDDIHLAGTAPRKAAFALKFEAVK